VELLRELEERAPFEFKVRDTRRDGVVLDVDEDRPEQAGLPDAHSAQSRQTLLTFRPPFVGWSARVSPGVLE
jgi:hypothetical protein